MPDATDTTATDGAQVRLLPVLKGESVAQFRPGTGAVSRVGYHRKVEEICYVLTGRGEMWCRTGEHEEIALLASVFCLAIPRRTSFGFRAAAGAALAAVSVARQPWPLHSPDEWTKFAPHC